MTQPATGLAWVRPPQQARSRATLDRLLDAAEQLLAEKGWEECSVTEIVRRAGSSVGAFYSRFKDKDGLFHAIHERFSVEAMATADDILSLERWEGATIPEIIRETVAFTVRTYRERAGLIRAFLVRGAVDDAFRERSLRLRSHIAELLRKLVLARRKELLHPAPAVASEFSVRLIHGLLQARAVIGDLQNGSGGVRLSDEQITTELVHAVLAYLGVFSTDTWDS